MSWCCFGGRTEPSSEALSAETEKPRRTFCFFNVTPDVLPEVWLWGAPAFSHSGWGGRPPTPELDAQIEAFAALVAVPEAAGDPIVTANHPRMLASILEIASDAEGAQ
jgi:hypothetical protein